MSLSVFRSFLIDNLFFSASNFYPHSQHDHHLSIDENADHPTQTQNSSYVEMLHDSKTSFENFLVENEQVKIHVRNH
jgi:hypothetical protein